MKLLFNPYVVLRRKEWHRIITHTAVHSGVLHLLINMFVFYMFGSAVEDVFGALNGSAGSLYFAVLYLGGAAFATLPSFVKHRNNPGYNAVGASGAVSSVLFAYVLMFPTQTVYLYGILPMYAIVFGLAYLAYEWYMDKKAQDNVAHDAHFYGAIFGVAFTILMDPKLITHFGYLQGGFFN
jgi:membrane associated rhomboid family serine protease